jgi:hypothetical protein
MIYHSYAYFNSGQFEAAKEAFSKGLELDPLNAAMKTGLENAKAQADLDSPPIPFTEPTSDSSGDCLPSRKI